MCETAGELVCEESIAELAVCKTIVELACKTIVDLAVFQAPAQFARKKEL